MLRLSAADSCKSSCRARARSYKSDDRVRAGALLLELGSPARRLLQGGCCRSERARGRNAPSPARRLLQGLRRAQARSFTRAMVACAQARSCKSWGRLHAGSYEITESRVPGQCGVETRFATSSFSERASVACRSACATMPHRLPLLSTTGMRRMRCEAIMRAHSSTEAFSPHDIGGDPRRVLALGHRAHHDVAVGDHADQFALAVGLHDRHFADVLVAHHLRD